MLRRLGWCVVLGALLLACETESAGGGDVAAADGSGSGAAPAVVRPAESGEPCGEGYGPYPASVGHVDAEGAACLREVPAVVCLAQGSELLAAETCAEDQRSGTIYLFMMFPATLTDDPEWREVDYLGEGCAELHDLRDCPDDDV